MNDCGRLLVKSTKPLTIKEVEDFVIGSFSALVELNVLIYGYTYTPGEGIYILGPIEELTRVKSPTATLEENFNFEKYIDDLADGIFWLADYLNIKGPTIMRMQR